MQLKRGDSASAHSCGGSFFAEAAMDGSAVYLPREPALRSAGVVLPDPMLEGCAAADPGAPRRSADGVIRDRAADAPDATGFSMVGVAG